MLSAFFCLFLPHAHAQFAVNQTYYLPYTETQLFTGITSIYPVATCGSIGAFDPALPITNYVTIAIKKDVTTIVYDHYEDGYEDSAANPIQPTTVVWGDGDTTNGFPPGFPSDLLNSGDVVILNNDVTPAIPDVTFDFDGRDKINSSTTIAVTRASWATGSSTFMAGAFELYPTFAWGTDFVMPIGEDLSAASGEAFEYVGLAVMADEGLSLIHI